MAAFTLMCPRLYSHLPPLPARARGRRREEEKKKEKENENENIDEGGRREDGRSEGKKEGVVIEGGEAAGGRGGSGGEAVIDGQRREVQRP